MKAKRTKKPDWRAPRDHDERAKLRAKADKKWPHPSGTPVTYYPVRGRKGVLEGTPLHTRTRSGSFYSSTGGVVVFIEDMGGYVLTSHLIVRDATRDTHWSDT